MCNLQERCNVETATGTASYVDTSSSHQRTAADVVLLMTAPRIRISGRRRVRRREARQHPGAAVGTGIAKRAACLCLPAKTDVDAVPLKEAQRRLVRCWDRLRPKRN